ncbi:hypothetical protein MSG28_008191 [Choristoneura fumiferana]|uniref:Uncharacterized protein n=1 Tax=Choristoneura fumiferana TaxID=7141 RepID=A0ACC0JAH1_CHOFU|nr:hypothetical protein MSG28_008191 [Choristoneura fumiferana]
MGRPQLCLGKYKFCERSRNGAKVTWRCTSQPRGCRASVVTIDDQLIKPSIYQEIGTSQQNLVGVHCEKDPRMPLCCGHLRESAEPKFGLSQRGNLVVQIGEWRFNKHACWGSKVRWTCIKKKNGCTAAITTIDNVIVKTLGNVLADLNPVFAQSQRGNPVIMIGQYRFNRVNKYGSRTRWVCVKAKAGCRASLHTMDNAIVRKHTDVGGGVERRGADAVLVIIFGLMGPMYGTIRLYDRPLEYYNRHHLRAAPHRPSTALCVFQALVKRHL